MFSWSGVTHKHVKMWRWPYTGCSGVWEAIINTEEWEAAIREELQCEREKWNAKIQVDETVIIVKGSTHAYAIIYIIMHTTSTCNCTTLHSSLITIILGYYPIDAVLNFIFHPLNTWMAIVSVHSGIPLPKQSYLVVCTCPLVTSASPARWVIVCIVGMHIICI